MVAHASATAELVASLPGIVAQSPFEINVPCCHTLTFLKFDQIFGDIDTVLKLIDVDGCKCDDDGRISTFLRHLLGGFSLCPPRPREADARYSFKSYER